MALAITHRPPTDAGDTGTQAVVGALYHYHDATYGYQMLRYTQLHGAVAAVATYLAELADQGVGTVSVDRSDDNIAGAAGGVYMGSCALASYQYVVINGRCLVATDAGVAADDMLVPHSVDGEVDTAATDEYHQICGVALEEDLTDEAAISMIWRG